MNTFAWRCNCISTIYTAVAIIDHLPFTDSSPACIGSSVFTLLQMKASRLLWLSLPGPKRICKAEKWEIEPQSFHLAEKMLLILCHSHSNPHFHVTSTMILCYLGVSIRTKVGFLLLLLFHCMSHRNVDALIPHSLA